MSITAVIARAKRGIALIQEHQTRLTANLVTGKLDVREAAAELAEVDIKIPASNALAEDDDYETANPDLSE